MRRPNLFILGAPRCGTTAMFEFLGAHPEIHPARRKEPRYFDDGSTLSLEAYLTLFADATDERWLLEGSPSYLSTPDAARRIRSFSPDSRTIVMVRDPVDQIQSLHDLRVFLGRAYSPDLRAELSDNNAAAEYRMMTRCGEQLARVLTAIPREAVHVIVYDDFRSDNEGEYRRTLRFLELDASFTPHFSVHNPGRETRNRNLQRKLAGEGGASRAIARATLPRDTREKAFNAIARLNYRARPRPSIDPKLASALWKEHEPDVELLSKLLDRDLVALWRR